MDTILMIAAALETAIKNTGDFNDTLKTFHISGAPAASVNYYNLLPGEPAIFDSGNSEIEELEEAE